ncbi:MAG TPA: hypothetical protein VHG32_20135 [Thermoanaerobaculia bacterium]|nr:hypothetical protein [Thermoanaerobaculia bacterium]
MPLEDGAQGDLRRLPVGVAQDPGCLAAANEDHGRRNLRYNRLLRLGIGRRIPQAEVFEMDGGGSEVLGVVSTTALTVWPRCWCRRGFLYFCLHSPAVGGAAEVNRALAGLTGLLLAAGGCLGLAGVIRGKDVFIGLATTYGIAPATLTLLSLLILLR